LAETAGPDYDGGRARSEQMKPLGTAQRNIAAAFVIASQSFDDPRVLVMVMVVGTIGLITLMPLARVLSKPSFANPIERQRPDRLLPPSCERARDQEPIRECKKVSFQGRAPVVGKTSSERS
jgi:hypothetical protein